jgi:hypothetical protein
MVFRSATQANFSSDIHHNLAEIKGLFDAAAFC